MNTVDKKQKLIAWLMAENEIELAILFGSYATGTENNQSDIDLGIQLSSGMAITPAKKMAYLIQLGKLLETDIDLVDLKTVGQPLLSQIIKHGKWLKGSSVHYAQLVIKNINSTQDFIPAIERILSTRRKRWLNNG